MTNTATPVGRYEECVSFVTGKGASDRIKVPVHLWIRPDASARQAQ
jgi:hypothetical protein